MECAVVSDSGQDQESGFVRFIYEAKPPAKHKMDRWLTACLPLQFPVRTAAEARVACEQRWSV